MRKLKSPLAALLVLLLAALGPVQADAKGLRLIRDAEIEDIIRTYATPLFQAAGLSPSAIRVYLVNDPSLNAFVTSGLRMFLHTGLLIRAEDPLQVLGVIAHETGHLAGGHTATRGERERDSFNTIIASYVVGLAGALATGRPEVATAAVLGGQDIALKNLLSYTRSQESAADQYAVRLLDGTGQSSRGLLEFMRILEDQEVLLSTSQDPYLRTHPLTQDRILFLENQVRRSPYGTKPVDPALAALNARMRAKLIGFLQPIAQVMRAYPATDGSLPARYARAIAHFRNAEIEPALAGVEALIAENPDDPYFHELKGQMLFENGRVREAVPAYEAAMRLRPASPQIRMSLAQAQIELNDPGYYDAALRNLSETLRYEPENAMAWRLAAIAHGRKGDVGMTALALAESALARGEAPEARAQAVRAQKILAQGTPAWQRAQDLEQHAAQLVESQ